MPKRDERHMQGQRERILRAVIECIADKGVERTSVADICRRAGMSTGALYVHFTGKEAIVAEALRYGSLPEEELPERWPDIVALLSSLEDQMGFDILTVVRSRLYLHAESVQAGMLHDVLRPILTGTLDLFSARLQQLADTGEIRLRMKAEQTAMGMLAFVDGMLWITLAIDRPLEAARQDLADGLRCFVDAAT